MTRWGDQQRHPERDLDHSRRDDHGVRVQRDPGGHLRLELRTRNGQVRDTGEPEHRAEREPADGPAPRRRG